MRITNGGITAAVQLIRAPAIPAVLYPAKAERLSAIAVMVIRYLEILEAIAETGTFTSAAKKLYITQSAVSHAVAELEKQTGTALFERLPKGAALTRCGVFLLEESRNNLKACKKQDKKNKQLKK